MFYDFGFGSWEEASGATVRLVSWSTTDEHAPTLELKAAATYVVLSLSDIPKIYQPTYGFYAAFALPLSTLSDELPAQPYGEWDYDPMLESLRKDKRSLHVLCYLDGVHAVQITDIKVDRCQIVGPTQLRDPKRY